MKLTMLLLSGLFLLACESPESYEMLPVCDVQPLASTFLVQCGNGTSTCSDGQGKPRYIDCLLSNGPELVTCVEVCHAK